MSELNLLPSQAKFQAQKMHLKAIINGFMWVFGGFWVIFLVIVLGLFLIFKLRLDQLDKTYQKNENQYKTLIGDMAVNQKIKYQAKVVAKVLNDRFEYGKSMELVQNLFPSEVVIENMEIANRKVFNVTGSMVDGKKMDIIEEKVLEINSGNMKQFESAKIVDVKMTNNKGWVFKVEVKLK